MNRKEFFTKINGFVSAEEHVRISQAYWLAKEIHRNQKRDGGERYFEHCRRVALYLIENDPGAYGERRASPASANEIIVALLHDCIEDGFIPKDLLEKLFGSEVAEAVEKLSKVIPVFDEETGAVKEKIKKNLDEYYQKIAESPVWIRRIKFADRLDNLRSMNVWPEKRKQKYIAETEKYILPIACETDMQFYNELVAEIKK